MTQATLECTSALKRNITKALKQWSGNFNNTSPLANLCLFRKALREERSTPKQITNRILLNALEVLEVSYSQEAKLLKLRFLDHQIMGQLANQLNISESHLYVWQRQALEHLAEVVRDMEVQALNEQRTILEQRVDTPSYTQLVGVESHLDYLTQVLASPNPPWIVSIEGIGGIGKTSLADALTRQIVGQNIFDDFGWVSARQTILNLGGGIQSITKPALTSETLIEKLVRQLMPDVANTASLSGDKAFASLRSRLKQCPHLIVIDNLETIVDVESLLPTLQRLVNPTKFVLTSRQRLYGEPNLFHFTVPELSEVDTLHLIRLEARSRNLPVLASSRDAVLAPIYATVGGNPLALRLVVGQTHIHSLETVLNDLSGARGESIEGLYAYIYRRIWESSLDPLSQRVLLAMPLISERGDDLDFLSTVSGLDPGDLRTALNKLVTLNLVDSSGDLYRRLYSIHNLTRTWLQSQIVKWQ